MLMALQCLKLALGIKFALSALNVNIQAAQTTQQEFMSVTPNNLALKELTDSF